ncbi:MAG: hypothetical protein QOG63_1935 [Thermoleophilaceae bacterium]|jgi:ribosome-associated toxin RatA of RatAB toxin-antitoxin module|nr:hypothetical protein [Thermoleophilaceae bacterium]
MGAVAVSLRVAGRGEDDVFERLANFASYPEYTSAVRSCDVAPGDGGTVVSSWSVNFRDGVLCWTEADTIDHATRRIAFEQVTGDLEEFSGGWSVEPDDGGCIVRFRADFDMGVPSLRDLIEPIAERTLEENIIAVVDGLVEGRAELLDGGPPP